MARENRTSGTGAAHFIENPVRKINTRTELRVGALASYGIMDTPPEPEFDEITRFASLICETPIACISLLDDHRQWFKSRVGCDAQETPLDFSFCAHALGSDDVMIVEDAVKDLRFCDNPMVSGEQGIRFYAGAPLITPEGIPLGAICAIDRHARTLTGKQEGTLKFLAGQTMGLLEKRRITHPDRERHEDVRSVVRRHRSLRVLNSISEISSTAMDARSMLEQALYSICAHTGWTIGHAWLPDSKISGENGPAHFWRSDREGQARSYRAIVSGDEDVCWEGLLGNAVRSRTVAALPSWHWETSNPQNRALREQGVLWGISVPLIGKDVWGAMEFYTGQDTPPDPDFYEILSQIGRLLGRGLERQRSHHSLKLSEAYFRHLVEESLDLVTVLDAQGVIRFESRSLAMELGWNPEEILGRNAFEFVHPDDCAAVMNAFSDSLRTEGPTPLLAFRFQHKDGSYRTLQGRGNNFLSVPAVNGVVFSSRDITEKRRLESQLGQLAGGIAHDFNNLLTVVMGYSSVAESHSGVNETLKNAVTEIRRASEKAANLTGQLLAFTGRQVLQPRVLHLDTQLGESRKGIETLLEDNILLHIKLGAGVARVQVDVTQFEFVLRNFAMNAYDAMPAGGEVYLESGIVQVGSRAQAAHHGVPQGDYVLITMRDTGCGMTSDVRARIFEPYFTTKPRGKGKGLGLATCQGIVKQSGGRIAVQSDPGVGTTMGVYLPIVDAALTGSDEPKQSVPEPNRAITILFAEDEEIVRELGVTVLEELGYCVLSAENGRAALDLLDASPGLKIDLLLTDVMMPEMDGRELAAAVRQRHPSTPILFCSGYAQDANFYNTLPAGSALLSKPYTMSSLADNVSILLRACVKG